MTNKLLENIPKTIQDIYNKVTNKQRISTNEALYLYENAEPGILAQMANHIREEKNGNYTWFNRNIHIEPTNICIHNCLFCSYSRKFGQEGAWEYSLDEIEEKTKKYIDSKITEIHIVGGVHPNRDLHYYGEMLQRIKKILPKIHIKAFTAVELEYMIKRANLDYNEGFRRLKQYGLDSIPGGGAEIFHEEIRQKICNNKTSGQEWLAIHKAAHQEGIHSNATMLYGHIEKYEHRIHHLEQLRLLQDQTMMFQTFIPLKYKKMNNALTHIGEVSHIEDMRNFAISRIFLDNFPHIKAYWPMLGKNAAQLSLSFGVDDIDGTIDDSTKIYSMAGAEDKKPSLNTEELVHLIKQVTRIPAERDTLYNILETF